MKGRGFAVLLLAIASTGILASTAPAQEKLELNTREWEVLPELQLKHNQIVGFEARNQSGSYVLKDGKLHPGSTDAVIKNLRRFGRNWTQYDLRGSGSQRVAQELYAGVISGSPDGWAKEKNQGDGLRMQNLCAALMERDSFGLFAPIPGKKLKWAKLGGFRGVEFNFEGAWRRSKDSRREIPYLAHGWVLDCPGDDLMFLFYGPDVRDVPYKDAHKVVRKLVSKVKPLSEKELQKYYKELVEAARGDMRKRKWDKPFHTVGLKTWPASDDLPNNVLTALTEGRAWLLNAQVDGVWQVSKSRGRNQIGLAALASRAIMGVNAVAPDSAAAAAVKKTQSWILDQQQGNGVFGEHHSNSTVYNHAIATAFLLDCYEAEGMPEGEFRNRLHQALSFIQNSQDQSGGWDYEPHDRDSMKCDPSATFWNIIALVRGVECGFKVPDDALINARNAMLSMAGSSGKVGYNEPGGDVARLAAKGQQFPWAKSEALTGAGLYCTLLVDTLLLTAAEPSAFQWRATSRCLNSAPSMDHEALDLYYWQVASCAFTLMGGNEERKWRKALIDSLLKWRIDKKSDPNFGAWTKETAWGDEGGYALTTSLAMLSLLNAHAAPRLNLE